MTLDLEKYTMTDGKTALSSAEFNARFYPIVRRLHVLEDLSISWSAAITSVQNYGLARINDAVQPLIDGLKGDLVNLIAQGKTDLASQSAAVADMLTTTETRIDADLASQSATVAAKLADVDTRMAAVEAIIAAASASMTTHAARKDNPHGVTAAQIGLVTALRGIYAGVIVEWEALTIPTLSDGLPLGLELDGSVAALTVYPNLARKWCGTTSNPTAPAWYKCNANGTRNADGTYLRLQDRRGQFARGWDHGRGVDAGRSLGSAQAADNAPHTHTVDPPSCTSSGISADHAHWIDPPGAATGSAGGHSHEIGCDHQGFAFGGQGVCLTTSGGDGGAHQWTGGGGDHQHWVDIGGFYSGGATCNHTHNVDITAFASASQGAEGRPRNTATMYLVLV